MINSLMVLIVLYSSSSIRRILYRALYRRCRRDMVNSSKVFCLLLRLLRFVAFVELNTTFHIIHHILDNFRKAVCSRRLSVRSKISKESLPTRQSKKKTFTPAAFAWASASTQGCPKNWMQHLRYFPVHLAEHLRYNTLQHKTLS